MDEKKILPVYKVKVGTIDVAVWEQDGDNDSKFYNTTVNRSYKDAQGEWKTTQSLRTGDIPDVRLALSKAYEWCKLKE